MASHNDRGVDGEELASAYLQKKGYEILERNWRLGKEEIDIIARKKEVLVVVEVKTRSGSFFGTPEEFVNKQKQRHLIRAANAYIEKKGIDVEIRFDVVGIIISGNNHTVNHLEDAYQPIA